MIPLKQAQKYGRFISSSLNGGINAVADEAEGQKGELSSAVNVWYKNGTLRTRPGFGCDLFRVAASGSDITDFTLEKAADVYCNEKIRIFIKRNDTETTQSIGLVLFGEEGRYADIALYEHTYQNDGYYPNVFVFSGKRTYGSGIYAVVAVVNDAGRVLYKTVYEINISLDGVQEILPADVYAPLIMINGKGSSFDTLEKTSGYGDLKYIEDYNRLFGAFRAGFITDGVSTEYSLPAKDLSSAVGEDISIAFKYGNSEYKWMIESSGTVSSEMNIEGTSIKATVNRATGKITFSSALPKWTNDSSNLIIRAYKKLETDTIFGMRFSECFNSRVFLSGNSLAANEIAYSHINEPLYFPKGNYEFAGDAVQNITAFAFQSNMLVIFKENEVYISSGVTQNSYDTERLINGSSGANVNKAAMNISLLFSGAGTVYPDTVLQCGNRLVFLGNDCCVYAIARTSGYLRRVFNISQNIQPMLDSKFPLDGAFAADIDGRYMLVLYDSIFLFNYRDKSFYSLANSMTADVSVAWYYWETGGLGEVDLFSCCNGRLLGMASSGGKYYIAGYTLGGENDSYANTLENGIEFSKAAISASVTTGCFGLCDRDIIARRLILNMADGTQQGSIAYGICCDGRSNTLTVENVIKGKKRMYYCTKARCSKVQVYIASDNALSLSSCVIEYSSLNEQIRG